MRYVAEPFSLFQPLPVWTRCFLCKRSMVDAKPAVREFEDIAVQREIDAEERAPWDTEGAFDVVVKCPRCDQEHLASGETSSTARKTPTRMETSSPSPITGRARCGQCHRYSSSHLVSPKLVRRELERAAGLFWADPAACLTALRLATEAFFEAQRVPRLQANGRFHNLHNRINDYARGLEQPLRDEFRAFLHALREVGNDGTHGRRRGGPLMRDFKTAQQIRDATVLLERVLALKYGAPPQPALDTARRRLRARDRRAARPRPQRQGA